MTFAEAARVAAIAWRDLSKLVPASARVAAPFGGGAGPAVDVCLPADLAYLNLLPDAREIGLDRFARAGINWHHGSNAMCGNHLLSSQVQCVNALAPLIRDPAGLRQMFATVLDIEEPLPMMDPDADPEDLVSFEWIGLADHLGERAGRVPTRGSNTTSADAAIRYRASTGAIEVALIEWKYTERYRGKALAGGDSSAAVRSGRYRRLWDDADSPLRTDLVPYEAIFVEPMYQLFRLQQLAHAMERSNELGAERVRLVYAAPAANRDLLDEVPAAFSNLPVSGAAQPRLTGVWRAMLRRPDRFGWLDTGGLIGPGAPTSQAFKERYSHLVSEGGTASARDRGAAADEIDRLRAAIADATAILSRVAGEGSVIAQIAAASDEELRRSPSSQLSELTTRLEELAELARHLRAESASAVWDRLDPSCQRGL